ncbi:hypothetical protein SCALM49S_01149 [Streptomyces californicus]
MPILVGTGLRELRSAELGWRDGAAFDVVASSTSARRCRRTVRRGTPPTPYSNACSASLYALAMGSDLLAAEGADTVIVAGVDPHQRTDRLPGPQPGPEAEAARTSVGRPAAPPRARRSAAALPDATVKILGDCRSPEAMIEAGAAGMLAELTNDFLESAASRPRPARRAKPISPRGSGTDRLK